MYNVQRNNYHQNPKSSNIQTPPEVSEFIFELLKDKISPSSVIFDPCSSMGSLLAPWKKFGFETTGVDINENSTAELKLNFLDKGLATVTELFEPWYRSMRIKKHFLILCNPPFNGYGHKLGSEVWLDKIIELFGKEVPIVLFAPYNFRLPWKSDSKRLDKFLTNKYPLIASIISLPTKGLWEGVIFHSEILIFNIPNLQSHYFFNYESN